MEFGVQFFPAVGPETKSAADYWSEALYLTRLAETLGFTNVRTVEHYFHYYGGYSPNPLVFLSAAAAQTSKIKLITGAVLPVFNHPLKLAGEIGMVDAISRGRLEVGFARAFLPHEFARFGVPLSESRARFDEGLRQVKSLLENEETSADGDYHSYPSVTSLPRPTQKPRPPFWIASFSTPESFEMAGREGFNLMAIPLSGADTKRLLGVYRDAWKAAGHPGNGKVMLAFNMFCAPTAEEAADKCRDDHVHYLKAIAAGASGWSSAMETKDYPNYQKMIANLANETFESTVEKKTAWIGSPAELRETIAQYNEACGGFESASLQVNFGAMDVGDAEASMRLFAKEVMPAFAG